MCSNKVDIIVRYEMMAIFAVVFYWENLIFPFIKLDFATKSKVNLFKLILVLFQDWKTGDKSQRTVATSICIYDCISVLKTIMVEVEAPPTILKIFKKTKLIPEVVLMSFVRATLICCVILCNTNNSIVFTGNAQTYYRSGWISLKVFPQSLKGLH